jgi:RsiW-degrading membrane proteinase PrsW (M82 family)
VTAGRQPLPLERFARPRWGFQSGLVQRHMPAFWLFLALLLITGLGFVLVQVGYVTVTPIGWVLSWLLMLVYIVPVVLVIRWLDPYEREPRSLLVGAFLWGGVIATLFSGLGNYFWGAVVTRVAGAEFASQWSAALTAPVVEELYKVLGVIVLFLIARSEFDDLMDGFVYGAMIGLGFAVTEDVDYFISVFGGTVVGVLEGFWVRVIASGLYGHVLYTGLAGIGVAYFVTRKGVQSLSRRLAVAAGLLSLAMLAHFVWNSPLIWDDLPLPLAAAVKGLPFLIALAILLRLARRRENRWLSETLRTEVGQPGLLREELEVLADPGRRKHARKAVANAAGGDAGKLVRQLQQEQLALAMIASRARTSAEPDLLRQRVRIQQLRERLWSMPGVTSALGLPEPVVQAARRMAPVVAPIGNAPAGTDRVSPSGTPAWVGAIGTSVWPAPDPALAPFATLAPGTAVEVLATTGAWAEVRVAEGWTGWVDGRLLSGQTPRRQTHWE